VSPLLAVYGLQQLSSPLDALLVAGASVIDLGQLWAHRHRVAGGAGAAWPRQLHGAGLDVRVNRHTRQAYALKCLSKAVDRQIMGDAPASRCGWATLKRRRF